MTRLGMICASMAILALTSGTDAEVRTIRATGEYRMGDNDTRTDAKRLALEDAKRLALEQVGTYVESISEVRDMRLTRDEIRSYTAGIVEVKEVRTRAELDKDEQSTIIYMDVVCEIDSAVLARQMENLRRSESASRELNAMRAEIEKFRVLITEQSRALNLAKTKTEQERLTDQRQETLKNIDVKELLSRAWIALAGPESSFFLSHTSSPTGREEARRLITLALAIAPESAGAHLYMGVVLTEEGDFDGAINEYRQAIEIEPDLAEAHYNLGLALYVKGDFDGAISEYHQAIKIEPGNAETHYNLGIVLYEKGDLDEAINAYRQTIKIKPGYVDAHIALGTTLNAKGDFDGAISEYHQAIKTEPNLAWAHKGIGDALNAKGDFDGAISEYHQAIKIEPNLAWAHKGIGDALNAKGDFDGAISEYHQAIKIRPGYFGAHVGLADAHYNLGSALQKKGDRIGAIQEFRTYIYLSTDEKGKRRAQNIIRELGGLE